MWPVNSPTGVASRLFVSLCSPCMRKVERTAKSEHDVAALDRLFDGSTMMNAATRSWRPQSIVIFPLHKPEPLHLKVRFQSDFGAQVTVG